MLKLFLLFTVVPAIDLLLLVYLGRFLGPLNAVLLAVGAGLVGAWLVKREGMAVLRGLVSDVRGGRAPADRLVEGVLVLAGGFLLVSPGVLTDVAGLLVLVPPVRRALVPVVKRAVLSRAVFARLHVPAAEKRPEPHPDDQPGSSRFEHPEAD